MLNQLSSDFGASADKPGGFDANSTATPTRPISSSEQRVGDRPSALAPASSGPDLARKLPYRPNQQVEFLNLQVETEALLHQIHLHQRQRQSGNQPNHRQLATSTLA